MFNQYIILLSRERDTCVVVKNGECTAAALNIWFIGADRAMLEFLYRKRGDISYELLCLVYLLAVVLCAAFYAMEHVMGVSAVQGYWIVMSPFCPCLLWGLFMKYKAMDQPPVNIEKKRT